jgi:hypothetical protein
MTTSLWPSVSHGSRQPRPAVVVARIGSVVENVVTVLLVLVILAVGGVAGTTVLRLYRGQG